MRVPDHARSVRLTRFVADTTPSRGRCVFRKSEFPNFRQTLCCPAVIVSAANRPGRVAACTPRAATDLRAGAEPIDPGGRQDDGLADITLAPPSPISNQGIRARQARNSSSMFRRPHFVSSATRPRNSSAPRRRPAPETSRGPGPTPQLSDVSAWHGTSLAMLRDHCDVALAYSGRVLAPGPTARAALALLQLLRRSADPTLPSLRLLRIVDPADELVRGQRRDVAPGVGGRWRWRPMPRAGRPGVRAQRHPALADRSSEPR